MGWLSDKLSRTGVLQSSLFLSALATAWLAFQDAYLPLLFACLIIYGIVTRSRQSLTQAIVADSLPEADHDAAFSVFFFLGFISGPVWALPGGRGSGNTSGLPKPSCCWPRPTSSAC